MHLPVWNGGASLLGPLSKIGDPLPAAHDNGGQHRHCPCSLEIGAVRIPRLANCLAAPAFPAVLTSH